MRLIFLALFFVFLTPSCQNILLPKVDASTMSRALVATPGLSNYEYAQRLLEDGWPVSELNTAANSPYLNDDEKSIILAHNLVRHDPIKFAELYVAEYISYFQGKKFHYPAIQTIMITHEGVKPAIELYRELMLTRPMGLLMPSYGLTQAARLHVNYLVDNNTRGHMGLGGLRARVERFGRWDNVLGENISYGNFSAHDALLFMLIDDEVFDRSHREIILNPLFNFVGVGKDFHPGFPTGSTYVINYANHFVED